MRLTVNHSRSIFPKTEKRKLMRLSASGKLPRMAQITPGALQFEATYFAAERWDELETFCPETLVGAGADLQWLAEKVRCDEVVLRSVNSTIFVLTSIGDAPADDMLRVVLWQTFGVPVYELFLGADGMVLAGECEAHEGWHVEEGCHFYLSNRDELIIDLRHIKGIRTGLTAVVEREPCVCGRRGVRLLEPKPRRPGKSRLPLAAIA
jgi:hypothetical protein